MATRGLGIRRMVLFFLVVGVLLFGAVVYPHAAFGRAGGGEGYSGGGSGSGGGGGDGFDLYILFRLIELCIRYPVIGIPLTIVVGVFVYYSYGTGRNVYQNSVIRRGGAAGDASRRAAAIAMLAANDSAFDEEALYQRIAVAFEKIQQAWSKQDLASVRPFISDGVYERFSLQFDEQRSFGYRNQMDDVRVQSIVLADVECDAVFDVAVVQISASARDYRVSLSNGAAIAGSSHPGSFAEYWSFLRRRGTKTRAAKPGLIEGNCPNCGSAIEINQSANCAHCGAILRSGEHDWVLVEITQACEWRAAAPVVLGVGKLRRKDPDFNLPHLEDLASVIFWRKAMADRTGDIRHLRKLASPDFCERYARGLQSGEDRAFDANCAVGSVETLGVLPGTESDRALIEIRWSGTRFTMAAGRPVRTAHSELHASLLVLRRKAGVKTQAGRSMSSAHCPNCGGPESDVTSDACSFCGQVLNDGSGDWILEDILLRSSAQADKLFQELQSEPEAGAVTPAGPATGDGTPNAAGLLAWMVRVMLADGQVTDSERQLLYRAGAKRGVRPDRLEQMLSAASKGQLESPKPRDDDEARLWLGAMVSMALADGGLHKQEMALIQPMAESIGLTAYDLRLLISRQRAELLASRAISFDKPGANGHSRAALRQGCARPLGQMTIR